MRTVPLAKPSVKFVKPSAIPASGSRVLNGKALETKFISRGELQAMVPAEAVTDVGMYKVTVKSDGEPIAESSPAPLVVKFKQ